ncbi:MAG: hypothetical protein LBC61_05145 [Candidatus Peribacteria bacterium]|nr:hypothetical protein [Candidatus Peribacteria bacterium]
MKRKSIFLILFTLLLCNYYLVNACTIKPNFDLAGQCNPSSIYYDEVSCEHQTYMLNNLNEQCNS